MVLLVLILRRLMMKWKPVFVAWTMIAAILAPAWAETPYPKPVSPGSYTVSVMPPIDSDMATRIDKSFRKIKGVEAVKTNGEASSIHFTVKKGAHVEQAQLERALKSVDADAVLTTPVLENSLKVTPGL
jgi:hypothetical protein